MKQILKWTLIAACVGMFTYIGVQVYGLLSFICVFVPTYDRQDLIDNYDSNTEEITEVRNYFNSIVPAGVTVDIEFDGSSSLGIFHVSKNGKNDFNWDVEVGSAKADSLLKQLGWTEETLSTLYDKLDDANCISIQNGEPCRIGFQRSAMSKYYYCVFSNLFGDSLKNEYNDGCTYIYYKDNVVLEYGGGAIGPQCFEE